MKSLFILVVLTFATFVGRANIDSLRILAQKSSNKAEKAERLMKIAIALESIDFQEALKTYDEAFLLANTRETSTLAGKVLTNKGIALWYHNDYDSAIALTKKSIEHYKAANYNKGVIENEYNLGSYYSNIGLYADAIVHFKEALRQVNDSTSKSLQASILNNLGYTYQEIGAYKEALTNELLAIEIKKEIKDKTLTISLINLALTYQNNGDYSNAEKIYRGIFKSDTMINRDSGKGSATQNLANLLLKRGQIDSALYFNHIAQDFFKSVGQVEKIINAKVQEAEIYSTKMKYEKSILLLNECLIQHNDLITLEGKHKISKSQAQAYFGLWQQKQKQQYLDLALEEARKAANYATQLQSLQNITASNKLLSDVFSAKGNADSAFHYLSLFIIQNDSLVTNEKTRAIADMQALYQVKQKEEEMQDLEAKHAVTEENLTQAKQLQTTQYIVMLLLILSLCVVVFAYVQNKKSKAQIQVINNELVQKNETITAQNADKELLLKEIHHRVKNNLQVVSSLLQMQARATENQIAKDAIAEGQARVKSMALIHQLLYQGETFSVVDMQSYFHQLVQFIDDLNSSAIKIEKIVEVDEQLNIDFEKAIPLGLIATELIANCFKYAFEKDKKNKLIVRLKTIDKNTELTVWDSGNGLPNDFDIKKAKSLGLRLVNNLCRQLKGQLNYRFENGGCFTLMFPNE